MSSIPRPPFWPLLACPACHSPLDDRGSALRCGICVCEYACRNGVPRLLAADGAARELASRDGQSMVQGYRRPSRLVGALRRVVTSEYSPGRAWRKCRAAVLGAPGPLLALGSGVQRLTDAIHLDLDDFPHVDVVADAHALPFQDASLGGVICEVVCEHVLRPDRVIAEVRRVLRPGGRCYFTVPFLFPWHGHPADYRRWSVQGLAAEFGDFADVEIGIHCGPCSAVVNVLSEFAYTLTGLRFPRGYTVVKGLATLVLFPFKFADLVVHRLPEAHRLAATLFVAARRPA